MSRGLLLPGGLLAAILIWRVETCLLLFTGR